MKAENTQSQMRKGVLEYCILAIIRRAEVYPSEIIGRMKAADLQILEGAGFLVVARCEVAGGQAFGWEEGVGELVVVFREQRDSDRPRSEDSRKAEWLVPVSLSVETYMDTSFQGRTVVRK